MSKYIASTDKSPDGQCKRMMAHVLDSHNFIQSKSIFDVDKIVDQMFEYVKHRDTQILDTIMKRMDNNFSGNDATEQRKDKNEERK